MLQGNCLTQFCFPTYAGSNEVVLGDLVYFKGNDAENVKVVPSENEDNNSEDAYDCSQLDEISGTDLPEGKNKHVKVSSCFYLGVVSNF